MYLNVQIIMSNNLSIHIVLSLVQQDCSNHTSPQAYLYVVGMLQFMSDINKPSLPTPLYSVLVSVSVFMALSTVFHSVNSPDNSPFSHSVLPVLSLCYWSFQQNVSL